MIVESEMTVSQTVRWLETEAGKLGITARFLQDRLEIRRRQHHTFLRIPVVVDDDPTGEKERRLITTLTSEWNFRDPAPNQMLSLVPTWVPEDV